MYKILDKNSLKEKYGDPKNSGSPFDLGFPLFEISDKEIEEIYYFRWNVFSKHIKKTSHGYVVTEFLPDVPWAGIHNTISCAAAHHFYEGRWLYDREILSDYARFWLSEGAEPRKYSFPIADAIYRCCEVWGDFSLATELYDPLCKNYKEWESSHLTENGLFYQTDNRDGMELSISGNGLRPTINSYMYADALAISRIAKLKEFGDDAEAYQKKADKLKRLINEELWDGDNGFYKNLSEKDGYKKADVRELIGYVPWCYSIPPSDRAHAWRYLFDKEHFDAPYGPTTAERCHKDFMKPHTHECLWNGPSWPYATTQVLSAMINLIKEYDQDTVTERDFYALLKKYAKSQHVIENGKRIPFIDENLDPFDGRWLAREILRAQYPPRADRDRGKDYNHSSFCDLVIRGLCGITVCGDKVTLKPLFDEEKIDFFCLDGVLIQGKYYTVLYDKYGEKYGLGKGIFAV